MSGFDVDRAPGDWQMPTGGTEERERPIGASLGRCGPEPGEEA